MAGFPSFRPKEEMSATQHLQSMAFGVPSQKYTADVPIENALVCSVKHRVFTRHQARAGRTGMGKGFDGA